jgi:phi LC3 family holin
MNFRVRFRNKTFWLTVIPAIITVIYAVLSLLDIVPRVAEEMAVKAFYAIISMLSVLGVLIDPTTKGIGDSERALTYDKPNED